GEHRYQFVPGPNHNFLNSTFSNNPAHVILEKEEPHLHMNRQDAEMEGIEECERVRVWNGRGECRLKVKIGDNVLPGVVVTQGLWSEEKGTMQLVNSLTPDRLADMGGGATFFSGRVSVEKA
ncbi:MAG: molybdopterin oxidoreductase, partial [Neobacillus sp.]|nr:molybdopterin oxidoreductase [Neobacillus sp.]